MSIVTTELVLEYVPWYSIPSTHGTRVRTFFWYSSTYTYTIPWYSSTMVPLWYGHTCTRVQHYLKNNLKYKHSSTYIPWYQKWKNGTRVPFGTWYHGTLYRGTTMVLEYHVVLEYAFYADNALYQVVSPLHLSACISSCFVVFEIM
jgi:hypothetical protein